MSSISGFSSTNPVNSASPDAFSQLTSGEFLQIIFTELANQDPFEPNDTQSMLNQLSSIRSIEADTQFSRQLGELVAQNQLAAASGLIGSLVSGISVDNRRVADLVISVTQTELGPVLNLFDGSRMFFSNIDEIVGPLNTGPIDPDDPDDPSDPDDPDDPDDPVDPVASGIPGSDVQKSVEPVDLPASDGQDHIVRDPRLVSPLG